MATPSLSPAAATMTEALRALERVLADSRAQWNDSARHTFDRRFANSIETCGAKTERQLHHLAQELANTVRTLDTLGQTGKAFHG